jgi:L-seryl-tRNA(Ser) seleniumtransferase
LTGRIKRTDRPRDQCDGVIIHTNLGRARLAQAAVDALVEVGANYCNLEYDLEEGVRGERAIALEGMLCELFGCEAAAVVNNCAAAVLLMLNTLAEGVRGRRVLAESSSRSEAPFAFRMSLPSPVRGCEKSGPLIERASQITRVRSMTRRASFCGASLELSHHRLYREPFRRSAIHVAKQHQIPLIEDLGSGVVNNLEIGNRWGADGERVFEGWRVTRCV